MVYRERGKRRRLRETLGIIDYGTRRPAADYLRVDEAIGGLHPRFFGRFFVAANTALCAAWPTADPVVIRNVRGRTSAPILIIGNDFDPRTSLSDARRLARALGMENSVLRYTGGGHTAFFTTTACVQDTAIDYLVQLRLLPEGFTCPGRTVAFSPSSAGSKTALTTTNDSWFGLRAPSAPRNR
jgi:pimeloyl-ACP methyl ester carboxylesterase